MKKKILILNRRDIKSPASGGAEIYTHELFTRITDKYDITHVSSSFEGAQEVERIDGIKYIRKGNELTTHFHGFLFALINKDEFDLVIDQFNGIGFMTFYFHKSSILIHQLYGNFWAAKLGKIGHFFAPMEKFLLKRYRNKKAITVSPSTKENLIELGFSEENTKIVYNGLHHQKYPPKEEFKPIITFLGRMEETKNPEDAIRAFKVAKERNPELKLYMVGKGTRKERLQEKYGEKRNDIKFWGFVSEKKKYELLRESSIVLMPSIREGWGQVVIQANMVGTPVIGYDVEGLRDSIQHQETGLLARKTDIRDLADKLIGLFNDKQLLKEYSDNALEYSIQFSWENSAKKMEEAIEFLLS